jgi:hypothetical protein
LHCGGVIDGAWRNTRQGASSALPDIISQRRPVRLSRGFAFSSGEYAFHRKTIWSALATGYSSLTPNENTFKETIMNIAKNMEAIFLTAIVLVSGMGLANAGAPAAHAAPKATVQQAADANMTVVTVTAKRLSAAEKAQLTDWFETSIRFR